MPEMCPICEDSGLRVVERDGARFARTCECRLVRRAERMLDAANIPRRYANCLLEEFIPNYNGENETLAAAHVLSKHFVSEYPLTLGEGNGLLFIGNSGIGKTHLAIGILQALVANYDVKGLFYDYRQLLKEIQDSYGRRDLSEREILAPVFEAEILVLDELGAAKPSDWVWDTVQHILNTRYNDRRTTIITTNYPNLGAGMYPRETTPMPTTAGQSAQESARNQTLGDRIGDRMLSRLQEMCVVVEMQGDDFRQTVKRARFGKNRHATKKLVEEQHEQTTLDVRRKLELDHEERMFRKMAEASANSSPAVTRTLPPEDLEGLRAIARHRGKV